MTTFEIDPRAERSEAFTELVRRLREFWLTAPADLKAAMLAGCEMVYGSEMTPDGVKMTVSTRDKIAVCRDPNGQVTVYSQR
jgi:hypothetical protein